MPDNAWVWVGSALLVAAAVGAVLWVRRRRYLGEVRALGWSHDARPSLAAVADLQAPPFGLGLHRSVDELVSGTTPGGADFRVFEYRYSGAGRAFSERMAALQLPFGLADAFLCPPGEARVGIGAGGRQLVQAGTGDFRAISTDAGLAADLVAAVGGAAQEFGRATGNLDLAIDGSKLVASGAPKDPQRLASFLAALDPVAQAVAGSAALRTRQRAPAPRAHFYGHPDWTLLGSDDAVLGLYPVNTVGYGHRTEDLVRGLRDGIRLDAFIHRWKTDRTVTETDAQGRHHTRTVTDDHDQAVCGFLLPFRLPPISVNGARVGARVAFESSDFNDAFTVRTEAAKFASDVTHPRMMEWLLAERPPGWTVHGSVVTFDVDVHDLLVVDTCEAVLRAWLARFPRFVWQDLGMPEPPHPFG